ncbi:protein adenylyltransferase SelO [Thalassolituus oleivorans]|uniref:protein adenylyltransferase SelO n=1 Tax=Thalassolituus oleivorans TaxID=187493 RepID=UPI0023F1CB6A|nr:YdiU family protein [Thalassolituus oleivorans]
MSASLTIPFVNIYATLPSQFYSRAMPTPVANPALILFNHDLATELGIELNGKSNDELALLFSGNQLPDGADPLAMAYSGHQFGQLNPQLGDGRALLLGDVINRDGQRRDIQLKGAGRTPYSRGGDGRSPIGPVLREYVMCEAMHALGVPTTRALAAISSGEHVIREQREPGGVFTRVASSHIRVGTFQYFAVRRDIDGLRTLADHVLARHYPEINNQADDRYLQLFTAICHKQAELIANWMQLGFIHGVMNTDNMTVSGETIDYGPCAFMDTYKANTVYSYIDRNGRYAYQNQPAIGQWNLARLAETLLSLINDDEKTAIAQVTEVLQDFAVWQQQAWLQAMRKKLGLATEQETDQALIESLLSALTEAEMDYTLFFRRLCDLAENPDAADTKLGVLTLIQAPACNGSNDTAIEHWLDEWQARCQHETSSPKEQAIAMRAVNPAYIPRNHRVAEVIKAAEDNNDFEPFKRLLRILAHPYAEQPGYSSYQLPPQPDEKVLRTFCGT